MIGNPVAGENDGVALYLCLFSGIGSGYFYGFYPIRSVYVGDIVIRYQGDTVEEPGAPIKW